MKLSPYRKALLAIEIVRTYVVVRRQLRSADFPAVVAAVRTSGCRRRTDHITPRTLGRAVARTLALVPGDSRCLTQSLVLTSLLARRGIDAALVIGVAPGVNFGAHAWVEAAGVPLLPARERRFERLVAL